MSDMRVTSAASHVGVYAAVATFLIGAQVPTTASATTYGKKPATLSSNGSSYSLRESTPEWKRFLEWGALRARVISWSGLKQGWDGEDGMAPSNRTIDAALAFMQSARATALPLPAPYIAGDGEIGFRWAKGDAFASVAFLDEGEVVIFMRDAQGEPREHVHTFDEACPAEVFVSLATFA